jgi:hypothetical protein
MFFISNFFNINKTLIIYIYIYISMKSGRTRFKVGLQGILRRGEGPTIKLYVFTIYVCVCVMFS